MLKLIYYIYFYINIFEIYIYYLLLLKHINMTGFIVSYLTFFNNRKIVSICFYLITYNKIKFICCAVSNILIYKF